MDAAAVTPLSSAVETVPLGHGAELHCGMNRRDGSVEVGIVHEGHHLGGALLHHDAPQRKLRASTHLVDADLSIAIDHFEGDVAVSGHLAVAGHELLRFDDVLARFSPCRGMVGDSAVPDQPVVRSRRFGSSQAYTSHVTRIFVDETERLFTDVGSIVKERMFGDHPPFVFNTVACTGAHDPVDGRAGYTDPYSPWFNLFIGYYQIDAPKRDWGRPFAYRSADGGRSEIEFADLAALGKSDWNWFANWMYGVPEEYAARYSGVDMSTLVVDQDRAEQIGESLWHPVSVDNLEFVSAYQSGAPDAARLVRNSLLSGAWRHAYGDPVPRPDWPESFVPTRMRTRLYTSYWEDDDAFHTVMFGAATQLGFDEAFLAAQLAAARAVIERSYGELGFKPGRFRVPPARRPASPSGAQD